jgi:YrbI family 3-deoxy-D-manno-octulosonate 8-phosphate phosphatase
MSNTDGWWSMQNLKHEDFSYLVMDFDGVMTDDNVYVSESGVESVKCSRFDGAGISLIKRANLLGLTNIEMIVVSSEINNIALLRSEKLGIKCEINVANKFEYLCRMADAELKISPEEFFSKTIYLGNDLNDARSMQASRISIAPINSHFKIKELADIVLAERGGDGFVRAAVEIILGTALIETLMRELYD